MLKSDWKLYAGIGIAIGIVVGSYLIHRWDSHHYYESPQVNQRLDGSDAAVVDALPAPDQEQYNYVQGDEKPDYDTRSVWAAEDAAYWAMVSVLIGGGGTLIVAFSLIYSATATKAALDAAKAAKDTLHNDRAWVVMKAYNYGNGHDITIEGAPAQNAFIFQVVWRNSGRSPAINANLISKFVFVPFTAPIPVFNEPLDPGHSVIGAEGTLSTGIFAFSDHQTRLLRAGIHKLIFYSKIVYIDIYQPDKVRVTEVCLSVRISGQRMREDGSVSDGIFVEPIGHQNGVT